MTELAWRRRKREAMDRKRLADDRRRQRNRAILLIRSINVFSLSAGARLLSRRDYEALSDALGDLIDMADREC